MLLFKTSCTAKAWFKDIQRWNFLNFNNLLKNPNECWFLSPNEKYILRQTTHERQIRNPESHMQQNYYRLLPETFPNWSSLPIDITDEWTNCSLARKTEWGCWYGGLKLDSNIPCLSIISASGLAYGPPTLTRCFFAGLTLFWAFSWWTAMATGIWCKWLVRRRDWLINGKALG